MIRVFRGNLVTPFKTIKRGQIEINHSKITYVGQARSTEGKIIDFGSSIIAPGFIDIHIHGLSGYDAMDEDEESIQQISRILPSKGVTGFLATIQTAPYLEIINALKRVKKVIDVGVLGAKVLGSHLEGPYINFNKKGAQQDYIREPKLSELQEIIEASEDTLKVITLAPEVQGGVEAVKFLKDQNVIVSAGHTDATYDEAKQAFKAGVSMLGHFWNGMRGLHHREPGIVGAGLTCEDITVELIADCHHVHPVILELTVRMKGASKVTLVSDSIKPAGLAEGNHLYNGVNYKIADGLVKLPSGIIAGSSIGLDTAVKNMVIKVGLSVNEAFQMASDTPAKILGIGSKGRLESGYDADLVIMDNEFNVLETVVEGITVYKRE